MAQFQDGDSRTINGVTYVRTNGSWLPKVGGAFANPTLPYQGPQAVADLTGKTVANQKDIATLPYDVRTAKAGAKSAEIKAQSDQIDLNLKNGTPPGDPSKSGAEYLATVPPGIRDIATAMLNNRYPAVINRNIPLINQAVLAANHANPSFDPTRYNMRVQLLNKTLTGSDADELKALNTAITHAGVLYDQTAQLPGGADYGWAPLTHTINAYENWAHSTSPGYKNFLDTAQKYGQEESKTYSINTGGGQQQTQANYDINDPGKTIQSNIKNDVALMAGRAAAIINKYNLGNGGQAPLEPLSPEARMVLERLAPGAMKQYFSDKPDPLAQAMHIGVPMPGSNPNQPPPPSGNSPPPGPGFAPPPTGSTNSALAPSDQFSTTPDPQSAQFWSEAAASQTPYRAALAQWHDDVQKRGLVGQTPPPPDAYAKAAAYIHKYPNIPYQPFSSVTKTPLAPVQQGVQGDLNNIMFSGPISAAGHALNSALANIPTLLTGDNGARYNAITSALHPNYSLGGDIAGTVAGAFGTGLGIKAAAPALGKVGSLLASNPARAAMTGDTLFMGGSGAAQNPDNPVGGAALGAVSGLAGNALGRFVVGPGFRALLDTNPAQKGVNAVGGMFGGSFNPPSALDTGQSAVFKRAGGDALGGIRTNLTDAANLGLPYTLADANPQLRILAGNAARKSPDVMATAENVLNPRQQGQAERAIAQLNNLAPVGDVPTLQTNILNTARTQSAPLYAEAKAQPVPDLTANPALKDILDRPAAQAAVRKGYDTALNNGEDVGTLTYATDPNGNTVQYGNPSWNVLHYTRQALDNAGETGVRQALDKQIANLNPGFKAADAAYSGVMKGSDALQAGSDASAIRVTPETAQNALNSFTQSNNLPQFQQGYTSNLADMIERQRLSGNPYNLVNGSLGQQAKLNSIFPQGAPNFLRAQGLEGDMGKTYQGVLGGSPTATRTAQDQAFDHAEMATDIAMAPATHGASLAGLLMTGARKGMGYLGDKANVTMSANRANAIAPYLFNPDPNANLDLLDQITRQAAARKAYLQNFGAVTGNIGAGMFGAPIVYGASQN